MDRAGTLFGACLLAVLVCLPVLPGPHRPLTASAGLVGAASGYHQDAAKDAGHEQPRDQQPPLHKELAAARRLQAAVGEASGLGAVRCEARRPRPDGPQVTQWCCLVPRLADVRKVKSPSAASKTKRSRRRTSADGDEHGDAFVYDSATRGGGVRSAEADNTGRTTLEVADGATYVVSPPDTWDWRCLPGFVIAGTQKSGSTALAAYLLAHPQVSLGKEKEMHYFDKEQPLGLLPYLGRLASAAGQDVVGNVAARRSDMLAGYRPHRNGTADPRALLRTAHAAHPDNPYSTTPASPSSTPASSPSPKSGAHGRSSDRTGPTVVFLNVDVPGAALFKDGKLWSDFAPGSEVKVVAAVGQVWHAARAPLPGPGAHATARTDQSQPQHTQQHRRRRQQSQHAHQQQPQPHKQQLTQTTVAAQFEEQQPQQPRRLAGVLNALSGWWRSAGRQHRSGLQLRDMELLRRWEVRAQDEQLFTLRLAPPFVNGEATPFYIAERSSCRNMALELPEVPRLVVLLRDPVERAYSEYQMKIRRVDTQTAFLEDVNSEAWALLNCALRFNRNTTGLDRCVPSYLTDSPKWKDLRSAFKSIARDGPGGTIPTRRATAVSPSATSAAAKDPTGWASKDAGALPVPGWSDPVDNLARCFYMIDPDPTWASAPAPQLAHHSAATADATSSSTSTASSSSTNTTSTSSSTKRATSTTKSGGGMRSADGTAALADEGRDDEEEVVEGASSSAKAKSTGLPLGAFSPFEGKVLLTAERLRDPDFQQLMRTEDGRERLRFDVGRCVGKGLGERVSPLSVFTNETESFLACAGPGVFKSPAKLDEAIGRCVQVKHGIAGQYVYRGLYAGQLHHCFKSVPKDKLLVLESDLLKHNPAEAMRRVHAHLGLAEFDYDALAADPDALHATFDRWYPSFEERSGWRLAGDYAPMPEDLRRNLAAFYRPFNQMLFGMLGETFSWAS